MPLLTQNSELRPHLIWNWSIPALSVKLDDGRRISTCPSAGICARFCYARNGSYLFSNVLAAHTKNLRLVLDETDRWRLEMNIELSEKRFTRKRPPRLLPIERDRISDEWLREWADSGAPAIRIHDSGDFFADWYLEEWLSIARTHPNLLFYAYTKEITMLSAAQPPDNFRWLASTGGTQDHLITDSIRHADVFPNEETMRAAGYESQDASDLLAVLLPTARIGIPANNIRHFNKKINGRTFSEIQRSLRIG
jgi:hypothetical protein